MKGLMGIMEKLYLTPNKSFDAVLTKDSATLNKSSEEEE